MSDYNILFDTDSYKTTHPPQYPPGTNSLFHYIEARGGKFPVTMFFGLQYILQKYLRNRLQHWHVLEAADLFRRHGVFFDKESALRIVDVHNGYWPVHINAVPEGSIVPNGNVLVNITNSDVNIPWAASYIESILLRVWYPSTVATISWHAKQIIKGYMEQTCDNLDGLPFKLHDFGARGVSSHESAGIGGCAHLVNFMGTDTVPALITARDYYDTPMAGFSIPAAEHSTITTWGKEHELEAYQNMVKRFGGVGRLFAVVSDSYDIYNAVDNLWGNHLRQSVVDSGSTLVVRPDSGVPHDVVLRVVTLLDNKFGSTVNSKGYKVLRNVRVIQGDGIDLDSIDRICAILVVNGYSIENIAFGMGGALLQKVDRDTQSFAMKCSAISVDGSAWRGVSKSPVDMPEKKSKEGILTLRRNTDGYYTHDLRMPNKAWDNHDNNALQLVYANGVTYNPSTLTEIRERADHDTKLIKYT